MAEVDMKTCTGCGLEQPEKNDECSACGLTAFGEADGGAPPPPAEGVPVVENSTTAADPVRDLNDPQCDTCEFHSEAQDVPRSMERHYKKHPD